MEKYYNGFDLIPIDYLWGAQCHFCTNVNYPINPNKEYPVSHMEKIKPHWYICDECIKKRLNSNQPEVINMKNEEEG